LRQLQTNKNFLSRQPTQQTTVKMDVDEDDDFYAPEEATPTATEPASAEPAPQSAVKPEQDDEDLEEGEEEDEAGSDDSVCDARKYSTESADIRIGYRYHHRKKRWHESCSAVSSVPLFIAFVAHAPRQPRYNEIRNIPQRTTTSDVAAKLPPVKKEKGAATKAAGTPPVSGADLPGLAISKIDVDAKPIYEPAGKPITQVNIDEGSLTYRTPMNLQLTS
jgi:pre-mRNA 3'-end-processing factor FIP1